MKPDMNDGQPDRFSVVSAGKGFYQTAGGTGTLCECGAWKSESGCL